MPTLLSPYPDIRPYSIHHLKVDDVHKIYVEECGNPNGIPILYVHGGPGSGSGADSRRFFNPDKYRIIIYDQRGAGRSAPRGELLHNTTQHLINDIELIRKSLGISKWIMFGGSWGSTLSLLYGQAFPQHLLAFILRGIFLARQQDIEWLYGPDGVNAIFPDYWEEYTSILPATHRHSPLLMYYDLLNSNDKKVQDDAAKAWSTWEIKMCTLEANKDLFNRFQTKEEALTFARIECHYAINNCFLEPNQILRNMDKITHIPAIIIHGRYDMVCPFENAWYLHRHWPKSKLQILPKAGHSSKEPAVQSALIRATNNLAKWALRNK